MENLSENLSNQMQLGVSQYGAKEYPAAMKTFEQILAENPQNAGALTNLALVQFQIGNKPMAVALLRKASQLDPSLDTAESALRFILPKLEVKEIAHQTSAWEGFRSHVLSAGTLPTFLLITAALLLSSGWLLLGFFGKRREAIRSEQPSPPFPTVGVILALLFVLSLGVSIGKQIDQNQPRATVVVEMQEVRSLSEQDAPALYELFGGMEVVLERTNDSWVQVTYPGGMTGWVPQSALFQTNGEALW